jgi:hypothetical protein
MSTQSLLEESGWPLDIFEDPSKRPIVLDSVEAFLEALLYSDHMGKIIVLKDGISKLGSPPLPPARFLTSSLTLARFLPSFLSNSLPPFLPLGSSLPSFLPSFFPSFFPSFLPSVFPSFLPSFLPSYLPTQRSVSFYMPPLHSVSPRAPSPPPLPPHLCPSPPTTAILSPLILYSQA